MQMGMLAIFSQASMARGSRSDEIGNDNVVYQTPDAEAKKLVYLLL